MKKTIDILWLNYNLDLSDISDKFAYRRKYFIGQVVINCSK